MFEETLDENGFRHSFDDQPAYIRGNRKIWYHHGVFHREDGPAVVDLLQWAYYNNGFLHRWNGPAYGTTGITKTTDNWFFYGNSVNTQIIEFSEMMNMDLNNLTEDDILLIKLKFGI